MPPKKRARASSPVLGSDVDYVERTASGRPARRSAGRNSLPTGYVSTDAALDEQGDDQSASGSGLDDSEDEIMQSRTSRKRKRASPTPSLSSAAEADEEELPIYNITEDEDESEDLDGLQPASKALPDIALTFNAPPGRELTTHDPITMNER